MLTEMEGAPYIAYLRAKKVQIDLMPEIAAGEWTEAKITHSVKKELLLVDKGLLDKATNAFVSFLRYYKEHQLSFIFALKELDIGAVANSFFLFRLPRVKEILGRKIGSFA